MPGTPGRLTPDRFGFSMPVTDPPFDRPPYYYRGIEVMGFAYETDDDAAAAIVPEGLTIAHSPAIAQLIFTNFHFSTLGAYTEAILGVSCLWEGEPVTYCANLLVTNEVGLIGGREPYGFPKLFGEVEWVKEHEIISAYAERPKGKRICTGVLRPRDILSARGRREPAAGDAEGDPEPRGGRAARGLRARADAADVRADRGLRRARRGLLRARQRHLRLAVGGRPLAPDAGAADGRLELGPVQLRAALRRGDQALRPDPRRRARRPHRRARRHRRGLIRTTCRRGPDPRRRPRVLG